MPLKSTHFLHLKYYISTKKWSNRLWEINKLSQSSMSFIGGFLSSLLLLAAETSVNPQGWSLLGRLLFGFIVGKHPYDQAWGSL